MKRSIFVLGATCMMLASSLIIAEDGLYVGAQAGVNFLDSHYLSQRHCAFDVGYDVGLVGGYALCDDWRAEVQVAYRDNDYRLHGTDEDLVSTTFHGTVNAWSFLINGYRDFVFSRCDDVNLFLGAGIGCDRVHQHIRILGEGFNGSYLGFAWQLMAGANYNLCYDMLLTFTYQYHVSPLRGGHHLHNHSIVLGLQKYLDFCF